MTGKARRRRQIVVDRRARVPFAVIAILLVVSSGVFVAHVDTRSTSTTSDDIDVAMERTESATQTALRDAVTRAAERAARQPVTESASTQFGKHLAPATGKVGSDTTFERYLRALISLEAREQVASVGQEVGDVTTSVHLPDIDDAESFGEAIDSVELEFGSTHPDLERGIVRVELTNVTIVATREGTEHVRRTSSVQVAVAHPVKQLHDRVETFQERLDAGITESGFTQRFNARIYALGWARGYAQYSGLPVTEVIANRHVVPAANDAVYRTQADVFGAADPNLSNAIKRGWLCMAMHDAEGLYGEYTDTEGNRADRLCEASEWLFGSQATGDPPAAPSTLDLLANAPGLDAEETLGVNETAYLPLRSLSQSSGEHSIAGAIDRVYEIDVEPVLSIRTDSQPEFEHDPGEPFDSRGTSDHVWRKNRETDVTVTELSKASRPETYFEIRGTVEFLLEDRREHVYSDENGTHSTTTTDDGRLTATFELTLVEGVTSPNANVDRAGVVESEFTYAPGPRRAEVTNRTVPAGASAEGFENYDGAAEQVLESVTEYDGEVPPPPDTPGIDRDVDLTDGQNDGELLDDEGGWSSEDVPESLVGGTEVEDVEHWLTRKWSDVTAASETTLPDTWSVNLDPPPRDSGLQRTIRRDLTELQSEVSDVTIQFERREMIHDGEGTGPFGALGREVRRQQASFLDRSAPYENVGQKAVYEARYSYFELLVSDLERLDDAHASALEGLDVELEDTGLGDALAYLQQGLASTDQDPIPLESSPLTGDVHYEVSGSPTYLVTENISSESVPAVDDDVQRFAPMAVMNENQFKLPYDTVVSGILSRLGAWVGLSDPDAELTLRMAGEALQAGELAEDAARTSTEYGDEQKLSKLTDEFEASVDAALAEYSTDLATQIGFYLYDDYSLPCTAVTDDCTSPATASIELSLGERVTCSDGVCEYHLPDAEACREVQCRVEDDSPQARAEPVIAGVVEAVVDGYGDSAGETAIAIDEGEVTEPLARALAASLTAEEYRPAYAEKAATSEWTALVRSAVQPAVRSSATARPVTLDDTALVEELDREVRQALEQVDEDMVRERFESRNGEGSFDLGAYEDWVDGVDSPVRVPAGLPLLPIPSQWFATVNTWDVGVNAQYARFEVSATVGPARTNYVRENRTVEVEVAGASRTLGRVSPIAFSGDSLLVVVVPPGKVGVGDRDDEDPECSPTWPVTGEVRSGEIQCGQPPTSDSEEPLFGPNWPGRRTGAG